MIIRFPHPNLANEDGIVAIGGELTPPYLLAAYKQGIFPWPISHEMSKVWFSPNPRGIIETSTFKPPTSFKKHFKKTTYQLSFNRKFEDVIRRCSKVHRPNQKGTWITDDLIRGYTELFHQKFAYSIEVWDNDEMVAGLYGVNIGDFFSAESMFSEKENASKFALCALINFLEREKISWVDTQVLSPVVKLFGGKEISRNSFLTKLSMLDWTRRIKFDSFSKRFPQETLQHTIDIGHT